MLNGKRAAVAVLLLCLATILASAQTTEFTYQGSLKDGPNPANGNFDFEFALFDGGGAQLGILPRNGVSVSNGMFSVSLDFGNQFPGANRFLEIRVRPAGVGAFTTLAPRQAVNSAPYSMKSLAADTAVNAANATNATTAGTATSATTATNALSLGGVSADQYLQTNGSGAGLTNLNASSIAAGTLANARLGQIPTANIADSAVTSAKISSGQVVKGVTVGAATLTDNVTLVGGANTTVTSAGNTVTIASAGGNGGVSGSGTPNTIAVWTGQTTLGPANAITQTATAVQLPNNVTLAAGAQGNGISFGSPNGETGMTINNATGGPRADVRFGSTSPGGPMVLKMVARPAGSGPPGSASGVAVTTDGRVGIGTDSPVEKLHVAGNAVQDRSFGGMAKAVLLVTASGTIQRCYNGVTGASTGNCGFTIGHSSPGIYEVDFGFPVDDRFFSVATTSSQFIGTLNYGAKVTFDIRLPTSTVRIRTFAANQVQTTDDSSFFVTVY
jgi:hypothetical protein